MSSFNNLIPALSRTPAVAETERAVPSVTPAYEIKETKEAYGVVVNLPGVAKENLEITAEAGRFRIFGRRTWKQPEGWTSLHRESTDAPFELVLTHDHLVATENAVAELKDGVLRVSLPKHEAIKPRKIAVG